MSRAAWKIKQVAIALTCAWVVSAPPAATAQVNWDAWRPKKDRVVHYPEILVTPEWVMENSAKVVFVDSRPAEVYHAGHLIGAKRFSLHRDPHSFDLPEIQRTLGRLGLEGTETVVLYGEDALRIGDAFWALEYAGQRQVKVLNGGVAAWQAAGGELTQATPPTTSISFHVSGRPSLYSDYDQTKTVFGQKGTTLLDWRTPEEWAGGHIPHSLPFPLEELRDERGLLKAGPDMRKLFSQWGPRVHEYVNLKDHVIVCGSGPPRGVPVHPYLGARIAGIDSVSFYPQGSSDWKSHLEAPLTRLISAREVRRRIDESWEGQKVHDLPSPNLILLDLRGRRDYEVGHIQGAVWIPPHRFKEDFPALLKEYWPGVDPQETPIIFYCYGKACTRSRNCSTWAGQFGFTELLWFKNGTEGWKQAGETLIRAAGAP